MLRRARIVSVEINGMQVRGTIVEIERMLDRQGLRYHWLYNTDLPYPVAVFIDNEYTAQVNEDRDTCVVCNDTLPEGAKYCVECGHPVANTGKTTLLK